MTRENATKLGFSEDHWLQRHLAAPLFTKTFFQLSRLGSELAKNVFEAAYTNPLLSQNIQQKSAFRGGPKTKLNDANCVHTTRSKAACGCVQKRCAANSGSMLILGLRSAPNPGGGTSFNHFSAKPLLIRAGRFCTYEP